MIISLVLLILSSCQREEFNRAIEIPDFDFPNTVEFEDSLSNYGIFQGSSIDLIPSEGYELLELSSILFSDYAFKQRLIKVPSGTQMVKQDDGSISFPNGTILTKTFFYYKDARDTSLGKRILETRLEIKANDIWNVATYVWNENQTEALLDLDGLDTPVNWIDKNGLNKSTVYHVPTENECIACHQSNDAVAPIGTTLLNLNKTVIRNASPINQLEHLQSAGLLNDFSTSEEITMVDYTDQNYSLEERGRAYLAMNCAHCHNPTSWKRSAEREFDFRYMLPLDETGILREEDKIKRALHDQEMPLIGTTLLDEEGVQLVTEFLDNL